MVCGPPGSGKSTLVSSYIAVRRLATIWYQLDEGDEDLATFFYFLGGAAPRRRRSLPLLTAEHRETVPSFTRRFLRALFARFSAPFALVLDNYQEVPTTAALHEVLHAVVENMPAHGRLIVISRSTSPSSLARHQAHQLMDVVDDDDLRFTRSETVQLIRAAAPGRWPKASIESVYARTRGWGAGVVFMAKKLASGPMSQRYSTASPDTLFDYFAHELFKNLDPAVQAVLLQTAQLPHITPAMAIELTGARDAGVSLPSYTSRTTSPHDEMNPRACTSTTRCFVHSFWPRQVVPIASSNWSICVDVRRTLQIRRHLVIPRSRC